MLSKINTTYTKYLLILITTIFALTAVACTQTAVSTPTEAETAVQTASPTTLTTQTTGSLSADEIAGLLFMREEEKLAHDVYLTLNDIWGMSIFNNIAASEQMHTDAVVNLLNTNGIPDPAANNGIGQFTNQNLQTLYDQLITTGSQSLADALQVGGAIEEIDILDLDERMNNSSSDILAVYQNLRDGSTNHLQSFASTYERQTGETYQPQYLDQAGYDAIMNDIANRSYGSGNNGNGAQTENNGQGQSSGNGQGRGNGQGNSNGQGQGNGQSNGRGQNG